MLSKMNSVCKNSLSLHVRTTSGSLCTCLTSISTCLPARADSVLPIIIRANLNSLPLRLFWRADGSGQRKSNIPSYLFNESDLLPASYLLSDCLCSFRPPSATLLRSVASLHHLLSLFPSAFHLDLIRPPSWCVKVITTYLFSTWN